jgi:hypothetical protein
MIVGKRYTSEPLELPDLEGDEISGADLIFYGVDHSWRSYVADVFIRPPHPLEGATITVDVSDALARLAGPTFVVTVIPVVPGTEELEEPEGQRDLLRIDNVRLRIHGV